MAWFVGSVDHFSDLNNNTLPVHQLEQRMHNWFQTELGAYLIEQERQGLAHILQSKVGTLDPVRLWLYQPLFDINRFGCSTLVALLIIVRFARNSSAC